MFGERSKEAGRIFSDYFASRQSSTREAYNSYATKTNTLEKQLDDAHTKLSRAKTKGAKKSANDRSTDLTKELRGRPAHAKKLKQSECLRKDTPSQDAPPCARSAAPSNLGHGVTPEVKPNNITCNTISDAASLEDMTKQF